MGFRARMQGLGLSALAAGALLCAVAGPATAADQFTLDAHADSIGPIVTDPAGNGYIAWERDHSGGADIPMFCKLAPGATKCAHPVALALPGGDANDENGALTLFPIVGPGKVVWVVTDRYIRSDTVIWTSTNGGQTFGAPHDIPSGQQCLVGGQCEDSVPYTNLTGLDDTDPITNSGDTYNRQLTIDGVGQPTVTFLQSSANPGLGFDWDATDVVDQFEPGISEFAFDHAAPYIDIEGSALGTTATGDVVEAYTDDESSANSVQYFDYTPTSAHPSVLTRDAGGLPGAGQPRPQLRTAVCRRPVGPVHDLGQRPHRASRKRSTSANGTPPPTPSRPRARSLRSPPPTTVIQAGLGENVDTGELAAVWPTETAGGSDVMTVQLSTDGTSFSPAQQIANLQTGYDGFGNARVAIADNGGGFVSFQDSKGLEVADLAPLPTQYAGLHLVGKTLPVSVTCSDPHHPCAVKITLTLKHTVITHSFRIEGGTTQALKLKLTPAALKLLEGACRRRQHGHAQDLGARHERRHARPAPQAVGPLLHRASAGADRGPVAAGLEDVDVVGLAGMAVADVGVERDGRRR